MNVLLSMLSGVLFVLAFPRIGWGPLIFVAHVPLLLALKDAGPRTRFLRGWITGFFATLLMQYWLAGTLVRMSGFSWPWAIAGLGLYSAAIGLQWALFAWLYAPVRQWSGRMGWLVTVPLLYTAVEHFFPAVFPVSLGHALYDLPALVQTAEWTGVFGPAVLIMGVTCVSTAALEEIKKRRAGVLFAPTAITAVWMIVIALGLVRMERIRNAPSRSKTTVAIVQPNVTIDEKRAADPRVREAVFERTVELTQKAVQAHPSLVVWPEGGFPFYFDPGDSGEAVFERPTRDQRYTARLARLALESGVDIAVGALRRQEGRTRNSAILVPRTGTRPIIYDKRRLLMFGERIPLADTFPALVDAIPGTSHYAAGDTFTAFPADNLLWVPSICYESIFSDFTRDGLNAPEGGGDVLLNLTNDVWFGDTAAADQHLMLQTMRAVEDRVWLVRATNTGISAFVSPTGQIVARTEINTSVVLYGEMSIPDVPASFYRQHGNIIPMTLWMLCLLFLGYRWRQATRALNERRNETGAEGTS